MLRVGKLLSLTTAPVSSSLSDEAVVITLSDTKTSHRKQNVQHASIRDPVAAALLLYLKSDLLAGDKIFRRLTPKVLRDRLRLLASDLQLNDLLITPHSFRRGGATQRFRETGSFHRVAEEDRWGSLATCRKRVDSVVANMQLTRSRMRKHYK